LVVPHVERMRKAAAVCVVNVDAGSLNVAEIGGHGFDLWLG
jgi:hypothetical protein